MSVPRPPLKAITVAGGITCAAAPASMRAPPWQMTSPMLARPNAWARHLPGTHSTNAMFAASW